MKQEEARPEEYLDEEVTFTGEFPDHCGYARPDGYLLVTKNGNRALRSQLE